MVVSPVRKQDTLSKKPSVTRALLACFIAILTHPSAAENRPTNALLANSQKADLVINQLYHTLTSNPSANMPSRITNISAQLLGKPYELGALGEGVHGDFDKAPLYRADAFDCETYVDTVLALALANNPETFKQCIRQIRYRDGEVSFINRNHFTCLDWNQNNQHQGYIKDITTTLRDKNNKPIAQIASAMIDKPAWYQHFSVEKIRLEQASLSEKRLRLEALKQQGSKLERRQSVIPYIPLSAFFDTAGNPREHIFKQIPNAAIIEIVRPNWDLDKVIGTHLNVSHLGFAVWDHGTPMFRETSSTEGRVVDVSLIDYLRHAQQSPTIKGINIQVVIPEAPLSNRCATTPTTPKKQSQ